MKEGRLAGSTIRELKEGAKAVEKSKKEYSNYLKRLEENYHQGKISYSRYIETLYQKREGRNIKEWISYLDKYDKDYKKEIQKEKRKSAAKKTGVMFFSLALIGLLIFLFSQTLPSNPTGFVTQQPQEVSGTNVKINSVQYPAVVDEPVKWKKEIVSEKGGTVRINLPLETEKININKIDEKGNKEILNAKVTKTSPGFFSRILKITGRAVGEQGSQEVEIPAESSAKYEVDYETPAPKETEEQVGRIKKIKVTGSDAIHYENVLAHSILSTEVSKEKIKLYRTTDGVKEEVDFIGYDKDNNGLIDYVEWNIPQLSATQTYELIIEISKAEHLDSNKQFISDIYGQVKTLDNVWSETIPANDYVRVTFQKNLTNENDITLYPRVISGDPIIKVYEKDKNEVIAEFDFLNDNGYNKVLLTNLHKGYSQDTFDLKILGGDLQFDYIVDPSVIILPNTTNPAYNGTRTELTLSILTSSGTIDANVAKIIAADNNVFTIPGASSLLDTYLFVNFTVPAGYYAINVSVKHNLSSTTSSRTGIALWNFGTSLWNDKINTSASTTNAFKSYNLTQADLATYVSGNQIRAMVFEDSGSSRTLWIDYIGINVSFISGPDTTPPSIQILFPINNTNSSNTNLDVNYTVYNGQSGCWYSNDTYSVNTTLASCTNITTIIWSEGQHNITVWANDTTGNQNHSDVRFTIHTIPPNMQVVFPSNNTNTTDMGIDVNYTVSDTLGLSRCWYTNNSGRTNQTLTCGQNITGVTWIQGINNISVYANDSVGNVNVSQVRFTIDTVNPFVRIIFPTNNTNTSDSGIDINYTVSDTNLASCWYSNDSRQNATLAGCANITTVIWTEGIHNISVWVNDSVGNVNVSYISFKVDTIHPNLEIQYPSNNSNFTFNAVDINYTVSDTNLASCWYSNDSRQNATLAGCANITTVVWTEGIHNITVYANDTYGNINWSSITFRVDTIPPSINITFPINGSGYLNGDLDINYTVSDSGMGIDECWYSNDTYSVNTTLANCENITTVIWTLGQHNVTVWVNDSFGNENHSDVRFTIEAPLEVTINIPQQNVNYSVILDMPIDFNVSLSKSGSVRYSLDKGISNVTMYTTAGSAIGTLFNSTTTLNVGNYTFSVYANDTSGNVNYTEEVNFTVVQKYIFVNGTVEAANGTITNTTILIYDEDNARYIYNETNLTQEAYIPLNSTYTITVIPNDIGSVDKVEFYDVNFTKEGGQIANIVQIDAASDVGGNYSEVFSINPEIRNFSNATVFFTATANALKKCGNWSYTEQRCLTNWSLFMKNLEVDQTYNFSINPDGYDSLAYGIIEISGARHLDANKSFISNIYDQVYALDGIWSETIPANDYVRVTFNQNLTNINDITIYPKVMSGTPTIQVYELGGTTLIAEFNPVVSDSLNRVNLTDLTNSQDTFDLKITGGDVQFDYIVDPYAYPMGPSNLKAISCRMENSSTTHFNYNVNCLGTYPSSCGSAGDRISCNDGFTENQTIFNTTVPARYSGVWINVSNVSITNCKAIKDVFFCFEWWRTGVNITQPIIQLDANQGASWTTINTTVPTASANAGVTCQNVTTSETWTCGVFFGATALNAMARNEINRSTQNITTGLLKTDAFYFNVTYYTTSLGNVSLKAPANNSFINNRTIWFAANFSSENPLKNSTVFIWNASNSALINQTNVTISRIANSSNISIILPYDGNYTWNYYVCDDGDTCFWNNTNWTFSVDTIKPDILIQYPSNNTNTSNTNLDVNYTVSDINLNCWYSNDSRQNATLAGCVNITTVVWTEGIHNITVYANDTYGNVNLSRVTFTIDTINPRINITYPINNTNTSNTNLDINFTASDSGAGIDDCWYSNDSRQNATLAGCVNITTVVWTEGIHNISVWVNDSAGNMNRTYVTFTLDTIAPSINITYPSSNNSNFTFTGVDVNYTVYNGQSGCYYTNNSGLTNTTIIGCANLTTVTWGEGKNNVTVYANDTVGNINWSSITFTVDTIPPSIQILFPINNTNSSNTNLDVNYTVYNGQSGCWYTNTSGLINYTWGCNNITNVTWSEGVNNVTVYANDTYGNVNLSRVTFTIDTINPRINITYPINNTNTSNTNLDINFTASDSGAGIDDCWYSNDSRQNATLAGCTNITTVVWTEGIHNISVWVNDSAGNMNGTYVTFTLDITPPSINITYPSENNSNFSFTNVNVNYTVYNGFSGCYYTNNSGVTNTTIIGCANLTTVSWSQGVNNITVYANDSVGNINWSSITFTVDSIYPHFSSYWDNNATQTGSGTAYLNVTVTSTNGTVILQFANTNYSASNSSGDATKFNVTITPLSAGTYPYNWTSYGNGAFNNFNISNHRYYTVNASAGGNPPVITNVYNQTLGAFTLNMGPYSTGVIINFTAFDADGDLNDSTAKINLTFIGTGEPMRENASCYRYESSPTYSNYTCNVTMWWFDGAGNWNITASILDNTSNFVKNNSMVFTIGATTGFEINPANLAWAAIVAGATNQTSNNDPLFLNNTGNQPIGTGIVTSTSNISINATNLMGEQNPALMLFANNFSVNINTGGTCSGAACVECGGALTGNLSNGLFTNVTSAILPKGNYTIGDGSTGQEQLYLCLRAAGTELTNQPYSTLNQGAWTIRIFLVVFIPRKNKKKKSVKDDKLLEAFNLIADELKEEYSLNKKELLDIIIEKLKGRQDIEKEDISEIIKSEKELTIPITIFSKQLGGLEAIAKYMKENLNMTYSEIAKEIGRNERTIWTSYKKAKEKQKEIFSEEKKGILVPISIFGNNELTIFESVISYLKNKGIKYSEIAKLLNRDQRNIRTIYIRTLNKKKRNV